MPLPTQLSNLVLPLVGAPMFIVSGPELVIAQCKAGIVGSFPALNAREIDLLDNWMTDIKQALAAHDQANPDAPAAPFAVNLIVNRSNALLEEQLNACVRHKVPIVITSLGAREEVNEAVHSYGGIVLHDVINNRFARKAIAKGADGLIAVAAGAGGHAGTTSPIALIQDIRAWFDGPLLLSGAITTGQAVLAAQAMGADLAYAGSLFIASHEAAAADAYKQMLVDSDAEDIVYTKYFSGIHASYLRPSIERAGLDPDALLKDEASAQPVAPGQEKPKAWRDIWSAGQGIGRISDIAETADIVARLKREYGKARTALCADTSRYAAPHSGTA